MIRLLKKEEVQIAKQSERKDEIDNGLKIARKVDQLRALRSQEEQETEKFRTQTVKIVQKEIDSLILKKENIIYEIGVLERQHSLLKKPFDEEWERIRKERISHIDKLKSSLESDKQKVDSLKSGLSRKIVELSSKEKAIANDIADANELLRTAKSKEHNARLLMNDAEIWKAQAQSEIDAKTNNLLKREDDMNAKELDISMREEAIRKSSIALAQKERFINDKYATLQRTEEYLKAKNKKK